MESHCLFRVGFSSLIKKKHFKNKAIKLNLLWHFFKILKKLRNVLWGHIVLLLEVISNGRSLVFFNSLVKMSARIADIPWYVTQVTLKIIHNALLIHKGWLVFPHFDFILDFPPRVHGADVYIDLPAEVS